MVRLFLLPTQLAFPGIFSAMGRVGPSAFSVFADLDADGDGDRDQRSSSEWHNAVVAYLKFRSGTAWRLGRARYRNAARYLEYLEAIRLLESIRYQPVLRPEPVLPGLPHECARTNRLPWWRRPWDHFRRCRCQVCRSLRMRGVDPQSTAPDREALA